jgi:hypothetical protein
MLLQLVAGRNYCHVNSAEQATDCFCTPLVILWGVLACCGTSMFDCHGCDLSNAALATYAVVSYKGIKGGSQSVTVVINALVPVTLLRLGGSSIVCDLGVTDACSPVVYCRSGAGVLPRPCVKNCCCALSGSWGSVLLGCLDSAGC